MAVVVPEREVKEFEFKQLCLVRLFPRPNSIPCSRGKFLACSNKYGLTFAGFGKSGIVFKTSDLGRIARETANERKTKTILNAPVWRRVEFSDSVSDLALSCDDLTLAIAFVSNDIPQISLLDVRGFIEVETAFKPFHTAKINASAGASILDMAWNPSQPDMLAVCTSEGSVELLQVTNTSRVVAVLPTKVGATCLCWSPKGKQLVIGTKDGRLFQFDQELKLKKEWPHPDVFPSPYCLLDVLWVSTYMFVAVYLPEGCDTLKQPTVLQVKVSKEGSPKYVSFGDVCYGYGEGSHRKYYLHFLQSWEMILAVSSTALEGAVIGRNLSDDQKMWEHWILDDQSRAEMPMTDSGDDSFPMGLAIDFSSQQTITMGGQTACCGPYPILMLLSTDGVLIPYYMAYGHESAKLLNSPPVLLTSEGLRLPQIPETSALVTNNTNSSPGMTLTGSLLSFRSTKSENPSFPTTKAAEATPAFGKPGQLSSSNSLTRDVPTTNQFSQFNFSGPPSSYQTVSGFDQANQTTATAVANTIPLSTAGSGSSNTSAQNALSNAAMFQNNSSSGMKFTFMEPYSSSEFGQPNMAATNTVLGPNPVLATTKTDPAACAQSPVAAEKISAISGGVFGSNQKFTYAGLGLTNSTANLATGFTTEGGEKSSVSSVHSVSQPVVAVKTVAVKSDPSLQVVVKTGFIGTGPLVSKLEPSQPVVRQQFNPVIPAPQPNFTYDFLQQKLSMFNFSSDMNLAPGTSLLTNTNEQCSWQKQGYLDQTHPPTVFQFSGKSPGSAIQQPVGGHQDQKTIAQPVKFSVTSGAPATGLMGSSKLALQSHQQPKPVTAVAASTKEISEISQGLDVKISEKADSNFAKIIMEEISHFESELARAEQKVKYGIVKIGSDLDKQKLKAGVETATKFCQEIKEITKNHHTEIQELRGSCFHMFGMAEECRVKQRRNKDNHYCYLLKSQIIDPASAEKMDTLWQQYQLIENYLHDVNLVLDQRQEGFKNKTNKFRKHQCYSPDTIYKTIKSHHDIIVNQKNRVDSLQEQLKEIQLQNKTFSWQNDSSDSRMACNKADFSSLAENLIGSPTALNENSAKLSVISPHKEAQLREHLLNRNVLVVKPSSPSKHLLLSKLSLDKKLSTSKSVNLTDSHASETITDQKKPAERQTTTKRGYSKFPSSVSTSNQMTAVSRHSKMEHTPVVMFNASKSVFTSQSEAHDVLRTPPRATAAASLGQPNSVTTSSYVASLGLEEISPAMSADDDSDDEDYDEDEDDDADEPEENYTESDFIVHAQPKDNMYKLKPAIRSGIYGGAQKLAAQPKGSFFVPEVTDNSIKKSEQSSLAKTGEKGSALPKFSPKTMSEKSEGFVFSTAPTSSATTLSGPSTKTVFGGNSTAFGGTSTPVTSSLIQEKNPVGSKAANGKVFKHLSFGTNTKTTQAASILATTEKTSTRTQAAGSLDKKPVASEIINPAGTFDLSRTSPEVSKSTAMIQSTSTLQSVSDQENAKATPVDVVESRTGGFIFDSAGKFDQTVISGSSAFPTLSSSSENIFTNTTTQQSTTSSLLNSIFGQKPATEESSLLEASAKAGEMLGQHTAASTSVNTSTGQLTTVMTTTKTGSGLFGQPTTAASVASTSGLFGQPTTAASVASTSGLFGQPTTAASVASTSGLFGQPTTAASVASTSGLFGQPTTAASVASTSGLFGQPTTAITSANGQPDTAVTAITNNRVPNSLTSVAPSSTAANAETQANNASKQPAGGSDSSAAETPKTQESCSVTADSEAHFKQSTSAEGFGQHPTCSSGGVFGQSGNSVFGQSGGLFGEASGQSSAQTSSVFGNINTGGVFGKPADSEQLLFRQTPTGSVFGNVAITTTSTTPTSGLSFGQSDTGFGKSFNQSPGLGQSAFPQCRRSVFGQTSPSASVFGQTKSPQPGGSVFGSSSGAPPPGLFSAPATETLPNLFGENNSSGGGIFSGLGGKPSAENANKNVFGGNQQFGQESSASMFSNRSSSVFQTSRFAASPTSQGVAAAGFKVSQQTNKPGGFGSPPAFGSSPTFGGSPAFVNSSTFGSTSAFGSSSPTFTRPFTNVFGSENQQNTGFANFAQSSSPSFGTLAQSAPTFSGLLQTTSVFGGNNPSNFSNPSSGFGQSAAFTGYRS